jgi:inositol phosphorylceramide mannosyltransferase catalytic subunit
MTMMIRTFMRLSGNRQLFPMLWFLALVLGSFVSFSLHSGHLGQITPKLESIAFPPEEIVIGKDRKLTIHPTIAITTTDASKTLPPQKSASMSQPGHVPKIVHQTWKSKSVPSPYREWRQECIDLNPDWEFKIWTDDDNRELVRLHYPSFLTTYDNYDLNIKRIDSARYMMLHRYGGLYMDLDITCLRPFGNAFGAPHTFYAAEQFALEDLSARNPRGVQRRQKRVANAFMAVPANHGLFTDILAELPHTASEIAVLKATGPRFLTTMLQQNNDNASSVSVFPMEHVYCQDWEEASTERGCRNITSCRVKCPSALTASFWAHSWKEQTAAQNSKQQKASKTLFPQVETTVNTDFTYNSTSALARMLPTVSREGHVPKIVHQTWKSTKLPSPYREWRQECIDLNPGWEFKIWTDDDNRELVRLHYPSFLTTYDNYDVNIKRVDSARYMILHRHGGVYMDLDMSCLQPFGQIFDAPHTFYAAEQFSRIDVGTSKRRKIRRQLSKVANAFMAAPSNHSLITAMLAELPNTAKQRAVLTATGPRFLTTMINWRGHESAISVFPMEKMYGQSYNMKHGLCRNITSCRAKCPEAILISFWANSWDEDKREETPS